METTISKDKMKLILEQAPKGSDYGRIIQAFADKGYTIEGFNDQSIPAPKPSRYEVAMGIKKEDGSPNNDKGIIPQAVDSFKEGFKLTKEGANNPDILEGLQQIGRGTLAEASAGIRAVFSPVEAGLKVVSQLPGFHQALEGVKKYVINPSANEISDIPAVQKFMASNPNADKVFSDLITVIGAIAGGRKAPEIKTAAEGAAATGSKIVTDIADTVTNLTRKSEAQIEQSVFNNFQKGVKPTVTGKQNASSLSTLKENVVSGVKTIKENKANLSFADDIDGTITGQTPKTLQQLADSIEQTKRSIFKKYDTLSKEAGKDGVVIDTEPVGKVLDEVINNKALNFSHPEAVKYAKDLKVRLGETQLPDGSPVGYKKFDPSTAQDIIQNYNKSLEAFYKNPTYDNASKAAIDAAVANNMRTALDKAINEATGAEYSALKKQYGALKSIEKDVVKATIRDARKNIKGLIDFTDVFSGGQIVNGILSLNPASVASGLTQKGIAAYIKYLNNPNRAIEKMFSVAEKLPQ